MPRTRPFAGILFLVAISACAGSADPGGLPSTSPQDDAALYEWLVGEEVPTDAMLRVSPSRERLDEVIDGDPRLKVGVAETIDERVEFSTVSAGKLSLVPQPASFGAIRSDGYDGFVWTGVVETPGATALRLELIDVFIAPGASLWVYGDTGEVFGPYTGEGPRGSGTFSVNTLWGEHAWLQVRYEGFDAAAALAATTFTIEDVGFLDDRFELGKRETDRAFCETGIVNADCVQNAECDDSTAPDADKAIAAMLFRAGRSYYICSGGLVADTANSGALLFLTANHCISRAREADSLETYWDHKIGCGETACGYGWDTGRTTPGATLLATGTAGDYTLLLLDHAKPGRAFLPFSTAPVANTTGALLHRNSHPQGAPLAYSRHEVSTSAGTCGTLPRGTYIYSRDTYGATEGGSSGSPVLNSAGAVVGQLYGACGTNLGDECDSANNATVDGALAAYYPAVDQFLDPSNACTPTETPEVSCGDSLDNDCDGATDGADPDCATGECVNPGGDPIGSTCSANADCCSNSCKGKPGAKTCK